MMDNELRNIISFYYRGQCDGKECCFDDYTFFDLSRTGIPLYNNMLKKGNAYLKVHTGRTFELKCITPDDYLAHCASIYNTSFQQELNMISRIRVNNLKVAVENGEKLYLPVLDFVDNFQKGKYRVLVARDKLMPKVPVMMVSKVR